MLIHELGRRTLVVAACVLASGSPAVRAGGDRDDLLLGISALSLHLKVGQKPDIRAEISNPGADPAVLVLPGDRSDLGGRTPIITWRIRVIRQDREPGPEPLRIHCGNINPLRSEEVFVLKQDESRELGQWVSLPAFRVPGVYDVQLKYENRPSLEWSGLPLGPHDADAMRRVRDSTPCVLESNVLTFRVQ
jgi:hypothetical protein